jgi:hypothetical protein
MSAARYRMCVPPSFWPFQERRGPSTASQLSGRSPLSERAQPSLPFSSLPLAQVGRMEQEFRQGVYALVGNWSTHLSQGAGSVTVTEWQHAVCCRRSGTDCV